MLELLITLEGVVRSYWYIFIEIISEEWTELATDFTTTINTMSCFIMVPPYSGKY